MCAKCPARFENRFLPLFTFCRERSNGCGEHGECDGRSRHPVGDRLGRHFDLHLACGPETVCRVTRSLIWGLTGSDSRSNRRHVVYAGAARGD